MKMAVLFACCLIISFSVYAAEEGKKSSKTVKSRASDPVETEKKHELDLQRRMQAEDEQELEMQRLMELEEKKEKELQEKMSLEENKEKEMTDQIVVEKLIEQSRLCLEKNDFVCSEKFLFAASPFAKTDTAKNMLTNAVKVHEEKVRIKKEQ